MVLINWFFEEGVYDCIDGVCKSEMIGNLEDKKDYDHGWLSMYLVLPGAKISEFTFFIREDE